MANSHKSVGFKSLIVEPLTRQAFEPFGSVIEIDDAECRMINGGNTQRFHALARVGVDDAGHAIINIFRGQPRSMPHHVDMMERHPLGSQSFYPLQERPWLVVVAPDDNGRPGPPKAFLASGHQGVNYHANIWHHPLMTLTRVSDFLVVDRDGHGENLEEYFYPATDPDYVINEV